MTPTRAKQILREVWGQQTVVPENVVTEVEPLLNKGETLLDCLQRIAGDGFDWRKAGAYTKECYEHFASL